MAKKSQPETTGERYYERPDGSLVNIKSLSPEELARYERRNTTTDAAPDQSSSQQSE